MAKEVSIFLENKVGHFERITSILKMNRINILSMSLNDTANGWGILKLLVNNPEKAFDALSENGISVALRDVIAIEIKDETGGLNELLEKVAQARINFNNAYGRCIKENKTAILILDVPDFQLSVKKLTEYGIEIISDDKVYGNL
jgi:hypothetical protein